MSNKWFNNIARLIKRKDGNGYFMVFERAKDKDGNYRGDSPFPLTINEGDVIQARLKKDELQKLVSSGKMSQETANKINEFVKFEFNIAPKAKPVELTPEDEISDEEGVDF